MVCPWFLASLFWHCCNVCFPSEYACLQVKYLLDEKKAIIKISIHYLENKLMYLSSLCKVITSSYQHKFLIVFISWFYFFLHSGYLSLLSLEEGNTICRWPRYLQQVDLVGADRQWQAAHSQQKVFDCGAGCAVSISHFISYMKIWNVCCSYSITAPISF